MLKQSPHDTPDYWEALGRFVQKFADAEFVVHEFLWELTDRDSRVPAALFADRMALADSIKALPEVFALREKSGIGEKGLRKLLAQLGVISTVRNCILHNGTNFTKDGAESFRRLRRERKDGVPPPRYEVSIKTLKAMAADCHEITEHISRCSLFYTILGVPLRQRDEDEALALVWQYKVQPQPTARSNATKK